MMGAPTDGAPVVAEGVPEGSGKKRRGRPKLKPGEKGRYHRKVPRDGSAPTPSAKRPRKPKGASVPVGEGPAPEKRQRGKNGGWLQVGKGWTDSNGTRTPTQLREKAREILAELGYPEAADIIADPNAKDSDKLRAIDILAKMSVGYMTPEMAMGEDAPELPAPIFTTTEGQLPGEAEALEANADATDDAPQSTGVPTGGNVVPLPTFKAPVVKPDQLVQPSGPMPYVASL
jgi:hypothetical protein